MAQHARIQVRVAHELKPLMANYLNNRHNEAKKLRPYLRDGDYEAIRRIGHQLKGSGSSFGIDELSEIGSRLESAAISADLSSLEFEMHRYEAYLEALEINYVSPGAS